MHNMQKFQCYKDEYEYLFTFLTNDLILPCILNETNKNFELDKMDSNKISLANEIAFSSIKFLQNTCENHNKNFQKKFFNHEFSKTVNIIDYPYLNNDNNDLNLNNDNEQKKENFSRRFFKNFKNFINKEENEENHINENLSARLANYQEDLNNEIDAKELANRKPRITSINDIDEKTFSKM